MLVNFSNHPCHDWSEEQMKVANAHFGSVRDVAFPVVDPQSTTEEVFLLAQSYAETIRDLQPRAVHVMGEMTFVLAIVALLQQRGIVCLASTTNRIVTESPTGEKISRFEFVQFRAYPLIVP